MRRWGGLQPVADIGQRARDDDRHRVVEERVADFLRDIHPLDAFAGGKEIFGHKKWVGRAEPRTAWRVTLEIAAKRGKRKGIPPASPPPISCLFRPELRLSKELPPMNRTQHGLLVAGSLLVIILLLLQVLFARQAQAAQARIVNAQQVVTEGRNCELRLRQLATRIYQLSQQDQGLKDLLVRQQIAVNPPAPAAAAPAPSTNIAPLAH